MLHDTLSKDLRFPPSLPDEAVLERYIAGYASRDERRMVETCLETFPNMAAELAVWRHAVRSVSPQVSDIQVQRAIHRFTSRVRLRDELPHGGMSLRYGQTVQRTIWTSAVGIVGMALLMLFAWQNGAARVKASLSTQVLFYETPNGQRANIVLPDGSTVVLNVGSQLIVPADYAAGNRTLQLRGEALFTAIHHQNNPLTVIAGASRTRVLGTRFAVRRYDTDSSANVAVQEGKVTVNTAVLTANQEVDVGQQWVGSIRRVDADRFSFERGVLSLNGVPLQAAIPALNRWFNVDIRIGDLALVDHILVGECPAGSIANLIEILEWTFKLRVVRDGRTLTLYPRV